MNYIRVTIPFVLFCCVGIYGMQPKVLEVSSSPSVAQSWSSYFFGSRQKTTLSVDETLFAALKANKFDHAFDAVKSGATVEIEDEQGISVLHWAVKSGNVRFVNYVLKRLKEKSAGTPITHFFEKKSTKLVIEKLQKKTIDQIVWNGDGTQFMAKKGSSIELSGNDGKVLTQYNCYTGWISSIGFRDGKIPIFVTGGNVSTRIWDLKNNCIADMGNKWQDLKTRATVTAVLFPVVLSFSLYGSGHGFEIISSLAKYPKFIPAFLIGTAATTFFFMALPGKKVKISPDFSGVVDYGKGDVRVYNITNQQLEYYFDRGIIDVKWSPDSSKFAWLIETDRALNISNKKGTLIGKLDVDTCARSTLLCWNYDGTNIAVRTSSGVVIWDLLNKATMLEQSHDCLIAKWSHDGKFIIGSCGTALKQWGVDGTWKSTLEFEFPIIGMKSVNGKWYIITRKNDFEIILYDLAKRCIATIKSKHKIGGIKLSPDGERLVGVYSNNGFGLWATQGGAVIDWAVQEVILGADTTILELLVNENESLHGLCNENCLLDLCIAASNVKTQHVQYKKLRDAINMIASKPGAPL